LIVKLTLKECKTYCSDGVKS